MEYQTWKWNNSLEFTSFRLNDLHWAFKNGECRSISHNMKNVNKLECLVKFKSSKKAYPRSVFVVEYVLIRVWWLESRIIHFLSEIKREFGNNTLTLRKFVEKHEVQEGCVLLLVMTGIEFYVKKYYFLTLLFPLFNVCSGICLF